MYFLNATAAEYRLVVLSRLVWFLRFAPETSLLPYAKHHLLSAVKQQF